MDRTRIAELLAPFLGADQAQFAAADLDHISTYIDILLRWNARINLTAIRDPEEMVTRHFGESLFAARHLFPQRAGATNARSTVADIGSGAGFPALPIKLWAQDVSLTLIESNHKKAAFLREVARALALADVQVLTKRAETLTESSYGLVTLRAVERFESILPAAANMISPGGGRLALLIGTSQFEGARGVSQLFWSKPIAIPGSNARILAIAEKSGNQTKY
jgi:16S rRNA (guanine527-N7)-methyltransferase